jgi:transcriptional regulator with XRE-family HTH domain
MTEVDRLLDKLMNYFKVGTLQELADKLGIARNTISGWKSRNSLSSVKRKIFELDLPIEIEQYVDTVNGGIGNVNTLTNQNELPIPESLSKLYDLAKNLDQIDLMEECIKECKKRILQVSLEDK